MRRALLFAVMATCLATSAVAPVVAAPAEKQEARTGGVWLAGDLHVHTTYSHDSYGGPGDDNTGPGEAYTLGNTVAEQFAVAGSRDLDFLAITDHNDVRSQTDPGFGTAGVIGLPGYEKSLDGHAQMLGADDVYAPDQDGDGRVGAVEAEAVAEALRAAGGVFQINHPAESYTHRSDDVSLEHLDWSYGYAVVPDTVEVWNISRLYQPPFPSASSNDDAVRYWEGWLDRGERVAATGGSDNHYKATLAAQGPGQPTTWVYATEPTAAGVLAGLRAGRTTVSHQPPAYGGPRAFVDADADGDGRFESMIGDTVPPDSAIRVRVEGAPGSLLHVMTDGGTLALDPQPVTSPDWTSATFHLPDSTWVRAEVVEPDARHMRDQACDDAVGDTTTYCRNRLGVLAMTSPLYLRSP